MRCPINLDKDFAEGLIALTTMMQTQEKICLPYDGNFTGNLSVQFNAGVVTLSSKSLCVTKPQGPFSNITNNDESIFNRRSIEDEHQLLVKEYGSNRFLRRDAAKLLNPIKPDTANGRLTIMAQKKLIVKAGPGPNGGFLWKVAN